MARPLVALMHGDRKVSTRNPARQVGCKGSAPRVLVDLLRAQPVHCALADRRARR
ncbi:MAG: hypothetical protein KJZ98_08495 [Burkholderiaceae bacterium]|jgi:hypothetical protein|nr:hypothetical protein [Burkholderiaceae bacterium]MEB2349953.1 hypothetical protein [Burkholderiaceae bacterium]